MIRSVYKGYTPEQMEALLSEFLIDSWSYSKVSTFSRNEKAFEMIYIYGLNPKRSASSIAGNAYHEALKSYFEGHSEGNELDLPEMEAIAFNYIDEIPANQWKIQKTTPTVEACRDKALTITNALLKNFCAEKSLYHDDIAEILEVEVYFDELLTVNGVDIPLPCHGVIDLIVKTKYGKTAVIDHKSKNAYTDEKGITLSIGTQAITYALAYESKTGVSIDEVWFVENKYSTNKDGSPQLNAFKVELTKDTCRLYEALLYEPLRKMISAVNDPDYVYVINGNDNFVDMAELYDFWARTMISEVEDFNVVEAKKDLVAKRLKKIRDSSIATVNPKTIREFKKNASAFIQYDLSNKNMTHEEKIEHVLRSFGIVVRVAHKFDGYSSNTYLLEASAGVKITSIYSHRLDIANALDVPNVRISKELTVYDGKSYVSVEFAKKRDKDLLFDPKEAVGGKIPLGKDNFGQTIYWDTDNHSTPHMLVCGATGSGKSVLLKSIVGYSELAGINEVIILDPKYEFLSLKNKNGIVVLNEIEEIEQLMRMMVDEMNKRVTNGEVRKTLVIFDEFADAVANSKKGSELNIYQEVVAGSYANGMPKFKRECTGQLKSLEENLRILLQKGRSTGFRIIAATQRASVKVITGDAKVNFPVQVCFRVPKETDSRVVIDEPGAESLAGMGDGLIKSPGYDDVVRFQAFYKKD